MGEGIHVTILPAIVTRRLQQRRMILALGGSQWNGIRMLFLGRSGKFVAQRKRIRPTAEEHA